MFKSGTCIAIVLEIVQTVPEYFDFVKVLSLFFNNIFDNFNLSKYNNCDSDEIFPHNL